MAGPSHDSNQLKELQARYKKTLVAEQPGLSVSLAGIILAILIGTLLRAAMAPVKILELIDQAAARIDQRVTAKVGSAYLSLADGIFPEFAVVVQDLEIVSEEKCWMRPHLEVNVMKLPISLWRLIHGDIFIHQIIADDVGLTLRDSLHECGGRKPSSNEPANLASQFENISTSGGQIDDIRIQHLHVHYLPIAFTTVNFRDFRIQVPSTAPKMILSSGILHLAGETLSGDYSSSAKVTIDYSERDQARWNVALVGQWREGHYHFSTEYFPQNQQIAMDLNMAHIPLSQLFPLLRKYHFLQSDFNGKQIWLTLKANARGSLLKLNQMPIQVPLLNIEGNLGEIEAQNMQIKNLDPLQIQPVDFDVRGLNLDELFVFLNRKHPSPALGKLGTLNGKASLSRHGEVSMIGDLSGLEFIFSNRGSRQSQVLSLISGSLLFQKNKWKLNINRVKPVEGIFLGHLQIEADQDWKNVQLQTQIDDLILGPAVQKLMTGGGEMGTLSADIQANFQEGILKKINGQLRTAEMIFDQMNIRSSQMNIRSAEQDIFLDMKLQGLEIFELSPGYPILSPYLKVQKNESGIRVNSVNAKIRTQHLNDLWFDSLLLKTSDAQMELKGGWDKAGQLSGQLKVNSLGKLRRYEMTGHRDQPVFQPRGK